MGRHQWNSSRRQFLTAAAGMSAGMLFGRDQLFAAEVDPRVAEIIASTITIDMHSHVVVPYVRNPANAKPDPNLNLEVEIRNSGFSAVCQTYSSDDLFTREPGEYFKYALVAFSFGDRILAKNNMRRALTLKDLQTAHAQKQPVVIQAIEGAQFVEGKLERLEVLYSRGLRVVQPVHNVDDLVAPLGDIYTQPGHLGGLTPTGAEFIKECNRLGIVLDLTHGTFDMVKAALKITTQPIIYSHTALSGPGTGNTSADMSRRMMSKEEVRLITESGGIIGVWFRVANSVEEYVRAIKEMVDTADVDHVGIGTDTILPLPNPMYGIPSTNEIWEDEHDGFLYAVVREMLKQGFTPEDTRKIIGGNFCRVFEKVRENHA
jgi:membrane dipeptidase